MSEPIQFFVPGVARPAGSKRAFPIYRGKAGTKQFTGHVAVMDANPASKDWKRTVALTARELYKGPLLTGALRLRLLFVRERPKNHFGSGKNASAVKASALKFPTSKPDCLKLARAVEDALTGIVYSDDSLICDEHIAKSWADPEDKSFARDWNEPGVWITVEEL